MDHMTFGRGAVEISFVWNPACVVAFVLLLVVYWKLSFIGFLIQKTLG